MSVGGPKEHEFSLPFFDYNIIEYLNILLLVRKRVSESGFKGLPAQKSFLPQRVRRKNKARKKTVASGGGLVAECD